MRGKARKLRPNEMVGMSNFFDGQGRSLSFCLPEFVRTACASNVGVAVTFVVQFSEWCGVRWSAYALGSRRLERLPPVFVGGVGGCTEARPCRRTRRDARGPERETASLDRQAEPWNVGPAKRDVERFGVSARDVASRSYLAGPLPTIERATEEPA